MDILLEGKKDLIKKLKKVHPNDDVFIDKIFNVDPTSTGKYSEWIYNYLLKTLPTSDEDIIEQDIRNTIIPFEQKYSKINDEVVKDYFQNNEITNDFKRKILSNPKDINSYPTTYSVQRMLDIIDEYKSEREKQREAKKNVVKVFEDDKYLVVKPLTYESSCYYGRNTRWCTASTDSSVNFNKYSKNGNLYYFIDKRHPNDKVALYLEKDGNKLLKYVYNSNDIEKGVGFLIDSFPELIDIINELTLQAPIIDLLLKFKSGVNNVTSIINTEIVDISVNNEDRGESRIVFNFGGYDNYVTLFDLSDDDRYIVDIINSHYSDFEYYYADINSEWNEGYLVRQFNESNLRLFNEIVKIISPENIDIDFTDYNNDKIINEVCETMLELFTNQIENIFDKYRILMDNATEIGVRKTIESDLCHYFNDYGFRMVNECFDEYETTVNNLIKLYEEYQPKGKTIQSLLKSITEDHSIGGWMNNMYEMIDYNSFDDESFQNEVDWELEKIIDELSENDNIKEYIEIVNKISSKYKIGKYYSLPRKKYASFRVNKIDIDSLTISVTIMDNGIKNYILDSIDDFYSLLYNYKLFDI
jgi:hypothetical protein